MKSAHRIVNCAHCDRGNTLDSAFCRKCGQPLDPAALEAARERNRDLVKEGMKAVAEGRLAEGVLVAQSALEADDSCVEAWALLAEARERDRDYPSALTAYTKLAELDPSSTVYPIKIEHLNLILAQESLAAATPAPNRRIAMLGAVAAALFVGATGIGLAYVQQESEPRPKPTATQTASLDAGSTKFEQGAGVETSLGTNVSQQPATQSSEPVAKPETSNTPDPRRPAVEPSPAGSRPSTLPSGRQNSDEGFSPLSPNVKIEPSPTMASNSNPEPKVRVDSDTVDEDPSTGPAPKSDRVAPEKNPSRPPVYDIQPSKNNKPTLGGSQPIKNTTPGKDTFSQAQDAFIAGRYESALALYQKALGAGGPAGRIYQRIGQCNERLGRKVDAIEAYEKAINIFESSGGNSAALSACKQAVQVLRGS